MKFQIFIFLSLSKTSRSQPPNKILITSEGGGLQQYFSNHDDGIFLYESDLPGENINYISAAVADFDNDGLDDIVLGANVGEPRLVYGNGNDVTLPGGTGIWKVRAADFNGDGHTDLLLVSKSRGNVVNAHKLLLNDQNGDFPAIEDAFIGTPTISFGYQHTDVCLGDFNGDGAIDALGVVSGYNAPVLLYLNTNDGSGKMTFRSSVGNGVYSLNCEAGDLNGDSNTDFVLGNYMAFNAVFLSNGDLTFQKLDVSGSKGVVALADVDNDEYLDLISQNTPGGDNYIWRNDLSGRFSRDNDPLPSPGGTTMQTTQYRVVDLNRDGWLDVLICNQDVGENKEAFVLLNDSKGKFSTMRVIPNSGNYMNTAIALLDEFVAVEASKSSGPFQEVMGYEVKSPTLNDFEDLAAALSLDECTVDIRRPPSVILECVFNSTNDVASQVHVIADSCENNENVSQPADGITSTDAKVSASVDFASMISETEKNSGVPFNKNFCARIDVLANNGTIDISVGAAKYDVVVTLDYLTTGDFAVEILTSQFDPYKTDASASRTAAVDAYRCDEDGIEVSGEVTVGSTLHICVYSTDTDVTLSVTSLDIIDANGLLLTTLIDENTNQNFVTVINEKNVQGRSNSVQIVSTLMVPAIFDAAGGETISATGTVAITFARRRKLEKSPLLFDQPISRSDEAPFNVDFELRKSNLPLIAVQVDSSGARANTCFRTLSYFVMIGLYAVMMQKY